MKRYLPEPGSELIRDAMDSSELWLASRLAYVETARALGLARGARSRPRKLFEREWAAFTVVEVDAELAREAAELALEGGLRTLEAVHLASALTSTREATFATWDERLWAAAARRGFEVLPHGLDPVAVDTSDRLNP